MGYRRKGEWRKPFVYVRPEQIGCCLECYCQPGSEVYDSLVGAHIELKPEDSDFTDSSAAFNDVSLSSDNESSQTHEVKRIT